MDGKKTHVPSGPNKHIRFTCLLVSVWRELYYSSLKYANLGKRESVHSSHIPQLGYLAIFLI